MGKPDTLGTVENPEKPWKPEVSQKWPIFGKNRQNCQFWHFHENWLSFTVSFGLFDDFDRSILTHQKVTFLTRMVCWVDYCIRKKPGELCPASETPLRHCWPAFVAGHGLSAGCDGTRGSGVVHRGTIPSGAPWYGSGCPFPTVSRKSANFQEIRNVRKVSFSECPKRVIFGVSKKGHFRSVKKWSLTEIPYQTLWTTRKMAKTPHFRCFPEMSKITTFRGPKTTVFSQISDISGSKPQAKPYGTWISDKTMKNHCFWRKTTVFDHFDENPYPILMGNVVFDRFDTTRTSIDTTGRKTPKSVKKPLSNPHGKVKIRQFFMKFV